MNGIQISHGTLPKADRSFMQQTSDPADPKRITRPNTRRTALKPVGKNGNVALGVGGRGGRLIVAFECMGGAGGGSPRVHGRIILIDICVGPLECRNAVSLTPTSFQALCHYLTHLSTPSWRSTSVSDDTLVHLCRAYISLLQELTTATDRKSVV